MKHEETTKNTLHKLGVTKKYSGYDYIVYGIELMSENNNLFGITKRLYVEIANKFGVSYSSVEKSIRYAIQKIWERDENVVLLAKIFGEEYSRKRPTSKVFFEYLWDYVKMKDYKENETLVCYRCPYNNVNCEILKQIAEIINRTNVPCLQNL